MTVVHTLLDSDSAFCLIVTAACFDVSDNYMLCMLLTRFCLVWFWGQYIFCLSRSPWKVLQIAIKAHPLHRIQKIFMIKIMTFCEFTEEVHSCSNTYHLYLGSAQFRSQLEHQLSWPWFLCGVFHSLQDSTAGYNQFLWNSFFTNYPTIR